MTNPGSGSEYLATLQQVCNLPTAPYHEQWVSAYLFAWAATRPQIKVTTDAIGNLYLHYQYGKALPRTLPPLVIEAHMDHPGFIVPTRQTGKQIRARFYGHVKLSHFTNATAQLWLPEKPTPGISTTSPRGQWLPCKVLSAKNAKSPTGDYIQAILDNPSGQKIPADTLGMWHLPEAALSQNIFSARVCDDLAGVAAALCLLDELIQNKIPGRVTVICSRAEEVGFAGTLAIADRGWLSKKSPIIGLETSKAANPFPPNVLESLRAHGIDPPALASALQGAGPVVRVGDKSGIFSPGLSHFLCQTAAGIADDSTQFRWQRKLMEGGTCSTTAFTAFGYDSASLTLALGNYHNMTNPHEVGSELPTAPNQGSGINSETIHYDDFVGLVQLLTQAVIKYPTYQPHFQVMRDRLTKIHHTNHQKYLASPYCFSSPQKVTKKTPKRP